MALSITSSALVEGAKMASLNHSGTGVYTLTLTEPYSRVPQCLVSSRTSIVQIHVQASSATAITIKTFAMDGTTAKNADLDILLIGADVADQN